MTDDRHDRPRRPRPPLRPPLDAEGFPRRQNPSRERRPPWGPRRGLADWPETTCSCDDCRQACLNSPGWFLPAEVERLADFLNLTLEALFRKCLAVGVTQMPDGTRRHGIMPHKLRDHKRPGALWTLAELAEPGRCAFYDHGKCGIYPVRPFECSRMIHSHRKESKQLRHHIVEKWTREPLRAYEALVGRRLFPKHVPAGSAGGNRGAHKPASRRPPRRPPRRRPPPTDE